MEKMECGVSSNSEIEQELIKLRLEHDKLIAAYGRLRWALDGRAADCETVLGLSPIRSRIIGLMLSGKAYTAGQLAHAAWQGDVADTSIKTTISQMNTQYKWCKIINSGSRKQAIYRLENRSIEYVKRKFVEFEG
jgi:hypothetical protein